MIIYTLAGILTITSLIKLSLGRHAFFVLFPLWVLFSAPLVQFLNVLYIDEWEYIYGAKDSFMNILEDYLALGGYFYLCVNLFFISLVLYFSFTYFVTIIKKDAKEKEEIANEFYPFIGLRDVRKNFEFAEGLGIYEKSKIIFKNHLAGFGFFLFFDWFFMLVVLARVVIVIIN